MGSIANPQILVLKESTLPWCFGIFYCSGKWTCGPDALSRYPGPTSVDLSVIREQSDEKDSMQCLFQNQASEVAIMQAITELGYMIILSQVVNTAQFDFRYQDLLTAITLGFPQKCNQLEPSHPREFWEVCQRFSISNGITLLDKRIAVPRSLRKIVLGILHSAHQGNSGMQFRANWSVYWLGLDADIPKYREDCCDCIANAPST